MKMRFEFSVASRYFKAKRAHAFMSLTTLLAIVGVGLGVMALIVVLSVMKGFEKDLSDRILQFQPHILVEAKSGSIANPQKIITDIEKTKKVVSASPFVETQALLKTPTGLTGVLVKGISEEEAHLLGMQLQETRFSMLFSGETLPQILLGEGVMGRLGPIGEEETLYLISPKGTLSPMGYLPGIKRFKMAGNFQTGIFTKDMATAYIALPEAQRLARIGAGATGISVQVKDPMQAASVSRTLQTNLGEAYRVKDWGEMNQSLLSALKLEQVVTFLILALVIFIAALNILSTLVMSVLEKTKDIAILKAMGASDQQVKRIFILNGLLIGGVGVFWGALMGIGICVLLGQYALSLPASIAYLGEKLPIYLDPIAMIVIVFCAVAICFLATIYPARRASALNPVESLKNG